MVRGPYFDELRVGTVLPSPPAVTLTSGLQAAHAAVVGNRVAITLDHDLGQRVAGGPIAGPALVWDLSIGQSTVATQHVRANLFYRGLWFHRQPLLGDTLRTRTEVAALRENTRRPGRPPTGLAELRITTVDQHDRLVLDYRRCAMVLLSPSSEPTGRLDELSTDDSVEAPDPLRSLQGWDLESLPSMPRPDVGAVFSVLGGDVVSSAPELARLTGNVARVHHDRDAAGGERLVYGGHSIGLALHHVCQALPGLVAVAGWHGCDHLAPVHEGDLVTSSVAVERSEDLHGGSVALTLLVVSSVGDTEVLAWRPVVVVR
ncbi:acyl dehydratase [Marmoricola sp. Leaf446]|uniref:MaoC family dehydratase n=1 Tax=Marmoricola sp. Leaf446 TaxID=1736379 RepID=UPI0006FF44B4|nr:MaoC family dehydratase [Marmoricola sp. Leaf446]KQT94783.1 acyl dehydratase [Marmoricola sp. Leaf446]